MYSFIKKSLFVAMGVVLAGNAAAHLETSRSVLNNNDKASITVKFTSEVKGDLYLATIINGEYYFFANGGKSFSKTVSPFQVNGTYKGTIKLLDVSALGIPANNYPLYEVVTTTGKNPLDFTNWVGGLGGLSRLNFSIGMPVSSHNDRNGDGFPDDDADHDGFRDGKGSDDCNANSAGARKHGSDDNGDDRSGSSGPVSSSSSNSSVSSSSSSGTAGTSTSSSISSTAGISSSSSSSGTAGGCSPSSSPSTSSVNSVSTVTPVTSVPTTTPATSTVSTGSGNVGDSQGQALYNSLTCSSSSCHTSNPSNNVNRIKRGIEVVNIRNAIKTVPQMNFLSGTGDSDLQLIANYLKTI